MKKHLFNALFFSMLASFAYGQNSSVNNIDPSYIQFMSESIDQNGNEFRLEGERGEYSFQYSGITDVFIEYHRTGIQFPKEEYYFPDEFDEIRKLKTNQSAEIPPMKFNQDRFFVSYNGMTFVDSLILCQYDTSDIQLRRYIIILTNNYNIEINFKLREDFIKTLIYQQPNFFKVDAYTLAWNTEVNALEVFGNELRVEKSSVLISKKWYDLTNRLLSSMKLF